ncbi:MAG: hypothetical protein EOO08_10540 [Chitinophagaceae bacterium]|nr:MAG: hypothetical protein EOO08_10540 [Chitinophagaceae bacterium]
MATAQQDSSHTRNVNVLAAAGGACSTLGARYAPEDEQLQVPVINSFCTTCEESITATYHKERDYNEAREARRRLFTGQAPFSTRIVNTLKGSKASEGTVAEARSLVSKTRGERAVKKPQPAASTTPATEIAQQISVSQTTFNNRLEHMTKLVALARRMGPAYKAPTDDLKLPRLEERLQAMSNANRKVGDAGSTYTAALIERDRLLYDKQTGIVARMDAIRTYFNSAFGAASAERKLLNGLSVRDLSVRRLQAV